MGLINALKKKVEKWSEPGSSGESNGRGARSGSSGLGGSTPTGSSRARTTAAASSTVARNSSQVQEAWDDEGFPNGGLVAVSVLTDSAYGLWRESIHACCAGYIYQSVLSSSSNEPARCQNKPHYDPSRYKDVCSLARREHGAIFVTNAQLGRYAAEILRGLTETRPQLLVAVSQSVAEATLGVGSSAIRTSERFRATYTNKPEISQSGAYYLDGQMVETTSLENFLPFFVQVAEQSNWPSLTS